jgi:hypothetical protein
MEARTDEEKIPADPVADDRSVSRDSGLAVVEVNTPHVAVSRPQKAPEKSPSEAKNNVVPFATRGTVKPAKQKRKTATRGNSSPVVEAGKGSKGTWQFRLRWNSEPGRPVVYVATVTDTVYKLIREDDYEAYKRSLIASYEARTVRASKTA